MKHNPVFGPLPGSVHALLLKVNFFSGWYPEGERSTILQPEVTEKNPVEIDITQVES